MINLRVGDLVARNAKISPDAVALIEDDQVLTWSELDRSTNRMANGLAAIGLAKNDRIATVIRNGASAVQMIFSIAKASMLAVPINYGLTTGEIGVLFDDSKPNAIIIDAEFVDNLASILKRPGVTVIVRGEAAVPEGWLSYRSIEERGNENTVPVHIDPDEIRTIRYTSGTTAAP
ncbi:AMP-binding protein [Caballeronia sp. 15711]|uniref:AMP-binding protein n=1 Tax=Caballeronia sp. 15711 TaxID=3391029 RepID=UPI0039E6D3F7